MSVQQGIAASDQPGPGQSLAAQIASFTRSAEERLPGAYLDAFRALVARLEGEGIGCAAPQPGEPFPDFALQDDKGEMIRASDHWAARTLIIKFYRGGWCPYCNLELAALQRRSDEFAALDAELFAVAPEQVLALAETRQKAAAGFSFLWDQGSKLARQLGIAFEVDAAVKDIYSRLGIDLAEINGAWELPVPATFVVRDGLVRLRHIDANYLLRQDPIDLIAMLRAEADPSN